MRMRSYEAKRCVCATLEPCWNTRCARCGTKLSTHDFSEEESQRFAHSNLAHLCRKKR